MPSYWFRQCHGRVTFITPLLPGHPGRLSLPLVTITTSAVSCWLLEDRVLFARNTETALAADLHSDLTCTVYLFLPFFFSHIFRLQVLQGQVLFAHWADSDKHSRLLGTPCEILHEYHIRRDQKRPVPPVCITSPATSRRVHVTFSQKGSACLEGSPLFKFLSFAQNAELTAIAELMARGSSRVRGTNLAKLVFLPDFGIRVGCQWSSWLSHCQR